MDARFGGTAHVDATSGEQFGGVPHLRGGRTLGLNGGEARARNGGCAEVEQRERTVVGNVSSLGNIEHQVGIVHRKRARDLQLVATREVAAGGQGDFHHSTLLDGEPAIERERLGAGDGVAGMDGAATADGDFSAQAALAGQDGSALDADSALARVGTVDDEAALADHGGAAIGVLARQSPVARALFLNARGAGMAASLVVVVNDATEGL